MMTGSPSVGRLLDRAPMDRPVALLLRHSVRDDLPPGEAGNRVPITEIGRKLATELGARIGKRLCTLHASPLIRCVQTAEGLRRGAGIDIQIIRDRLLGDPGVFVIDGQRAWTNWENLGHEAVMHHLVNSDDALPGMARPDPAARFLVHHMLSTAGDQPGLHIFITHDSLVTATAARLLSAPLGPGDWPWYLEGAFFWRTEGGIQTAYRDLDNIHTPRALCTLDETDIIEFARREIAATVGVDSGARFFLAGGAFKTLLTGHPPRDLDLWAPSARDRTALIAALESRGASRLAVRPFADAFKIADRVVEVPHKVEPATLDERLSRFDIALSAIGVEHRPDDLWSAQIHPLAQASVQARQVILLKPLINKKFAMATLERTQRYSKELGYEIPAEEKAEVYRTCDDWARTPLP